MMTTMLWHQCLASSTFTLLGILLLLTATTTAAVSSEDATTTSGGFINLKFLDVADKYKPAFQDAAARLNRILAFQPTTGPYDVPESISIYEQCQQNGPIDAEIAAGSTLANLTIVVIVQCIDGPGNNTELARAAPCFTYGNPLTNQTDTTDSWTDFIYYGVTQNLMGMMMFDEDDCDRLIDEGTFGSTVLHEMFHVLGFGALWSLYGYTVGEGTTNPQYNGSLATLEAYRNAGGTDDLIPLENRGSPQGTRGSHWRTSIFGDELMTGGLTGTMQPLTNISVMALSDLGYFVDAESDEIDPYVIPVAGSVTEFDWGISEDPNPPKSNFTCDTDPSTADTSSSSTTYISRPLKLAFILPWLILAF